MSFALKNEKQDEKMSQPMSILIQLIYPFDTNNPQNIYRFVRSCNSAFQLATTEQTQSLLVYALNNITGIGAADIQSRQYDSWDDLRTFLIKTFSNVKTITDLNLELQSMFQISGESLVDYYHRVDLCRSKIIEQININCSEISDETLTDPIAKTEETALSVFVNGLNTDIGAMLRTKKFTNLSEAGNFARQEDEIRAINRARQSLFRISGIQSQNTTYSATANANAIE